MLTEQKPLMRASSSSPSSSSWIHLRSILLIVASSSSSSSSSPSSSSPVYHNRLVLSFLPHFYTHPSFPLFFLFVLLEAAKLTGDMAVERGIVDAACEGAEATVEKAVALGEELVRRKWDGHVYAKNRRVMMAEVVDKMAFDETVEEDDDNFVIMQELHMWRCHILPPVSVTCFSNRAMNTGSSRMADQSFAMNGGKGIYSYAKNSSHQRNAANALKGKMEEAIAEKLDIKSLISTSKAFRIADFGCSTGPNTFIAMQNVVESIERKYRSEYPTSDQIPEFQVFFADQTSNDFNTLFTTSPPDRPYFAAGVAGSFYTRLFPECSLHFAYSCAALHYLSKIPNELLDETALSWNKGRIHYTNASSEVVKAYATQYAEGIRMFLDARAKEVVAGGMVVIIMPINPSGLSYKQTNRGVLMEFLESCLLDMVKEGIISEDKVDSFNFPIYVPSLEEMSEYVERNGCFTVEKMELTTEGSRTMVPDNLGVGQAITMKFRAVAEGILSQHFGSGIIDELFRRYAKRVDECSYAFQQNKLASPKLFMVLIRK